MLKKERKSVANRTTWDPPPYPHQLTCISCSTPLNKSEPITALSPDYFSQQCRGELSEGLGLMISAEKNSEVAAGWDQWGWGIVSLGKEWKNLSFPLPPPPPTLPFLSQTGRSSEQLSGMEWPHVEKGRKRDKMAPGLSSSSVIHGSRQFPPRILNPRGRSYPYLPPLCWKFLILLPFQAGYTKVGE